MSNLIYLPVSHGPCGIENASAFVSINRNNEVKLTSLWDHGFMAILNALSKARITFEVRPCHDEGKFSMQAVAYWGDIKDIMSSKPFEAKFIIE